MKKDKLGDTRNFGIQTQVYTMRCWVICDNEKDLQEELDKIESMKNEKNYYRR